MEADRPLAPGVPAPLGPGRMGALFGPTFPLGFPLWWGPLNADPDLFDPIP